MRYPLSDNTDRYRGTITFTPIEESYTNPGQLTSDGIKAAGAALGQFVENFSSLPGVGTSDYQVSQEAAVNLDIFGSGNSFTSTTPAAVASKPTKTEIKYDEFGDLISNSTKSSYNPDLYDPRGRDQLPNIGVVDQSILNRMNVYGNQASATIKKTPVVAPRTAPKETYSTPQKKIVDLGNLSNFNKSSTSGRTMTNSTPSGPVTLYLPQAIQVNDGVQYDRNFDLGIIGGAAMEAAKAGKNVGSAISETIKQGMNSAAQFISNPTGMEKDLAALAAVRLAGFSTGENSSVTNFARLATGVTNNPNTRTLFKNVNLREFSFNFKMIATSRDEAIAIRKIIKTFRTELYPLAITIGGTGFDIPAGYKFPNKFRISLRYDDQDIGIRFLDSNLISVQTVYNQSSMGWHEEGLPSEVDLTLFFGEPRALSKQDILADIA